MRLSGLEFKLEGLIPVHSGELLIIDPCYLKNFDVKDFDELENSVFDDWQKLRERELENFREMSQVVMENADYLLKENDDGKKSLDENSRSKSNAYKRKIKELGRENEAIEKEKELLQQKPSFSPPYVTQGGDGCVMFSNPIGDGNYPVIQVPDGFRVIFNYPLMEDGRLDESKLKGKLIGRSKVDSGRQLLIDASEVEIQGPDKIHSGAYCKVPVAEGLYACRIIEGNHVLAIRKK